MASPSDRTAASIVWYVGTRCSRSARTAAESVDMLCTTTGSPVAWTASPSAPTTSSSAPTSDSVSVPYDPK